MYYKYIVASTVGLFLGISISLSLDFSSEIFIVSLFLSMGNFFIYKFSKKSYGIYSNYLAKIFLTLFLFTSFGILFGQYSISQKLEKKENFESYITYKTSFTGIVNDIKVSQGSQNFILNIKDEGNNDYKVQIITSLYPKYKSGEFIEVEGKLSFGDIVLPDIKNYTKSFNSLEKNNILDIQGQIVYPKIKSTNKFSSNIFYTIENLKIKMVNNLERLSSIKVAALSAGTVLGDSSLFSKEELLNFRKSGLSHIIVLSGFNITILIFISFYLLKFFNFRLRTRIFVSIFFIFIFVSLVGSTASIIRSAIMGTLTLMAYGYGRQYLAKQSLFISTLLMIIFNPFITLYDISFHLSFLATFGILYFLPILEDYDFIKKINQKIFSIKNNFFKNFIKDIFDILQVTVAVQIFVTPYIMYTFGKISLFGIFANILVLPFITIVMIFGLFIILFSFLSFYISTIFSFLSIIFCNYIFYVSDFFASISYSQYTDTISFFNMIIIYTILILTLFFEEERKIIRNNLIEN